MLTNNLNLPKPFVDAVTKDYKPTDKQYSVTTVLKGTREIILGRRHSNEIVEDVADKVWLVFGSAVHQILENSQETQNQIKENKIKVVMNNGYTLSGIFDLYDDDTKTVTDYKTASVWKVKMGEWEDYKKQTLIYCYMLRKIGFEAKRGEIVALLKDWKPRDAKYDHNYPQHAVYRIGWDFNEEDFQRIEKELNDKFKEIEICELVKDEELPLCSNEERWKKEDQWKVMKQGRKTAVRVLNTAEEADKYITDNNLPRPLHYTQLFPGEDAKCIEYCSVCEFCEYYKKKYKGVNENE